MTPHWYHVTLQDQVYVAEQLMVSVSNAGTVAPEAQALAEKIRQDLIALQSALAVYVKPKT